MCLTPKTDILMFYSPIEVSAVTEERSMFVEVEVKININPLTIMIIIIIITLIQCSTASIYELSALYIINMIIKMEKEKKRGGGGGGRKKTSTVNTYTNAQAFHTPPPTI